MARIKLSDVDEASWITGKDMATPEIAETLDPDEANTLINIHAEGSDDSLQLFEVKLPAGTKQRVHAHQHDEIIYVVGGTMRVGQRTLKPGSSLFVAGETFYSFEAGPDGLHFLNFRPCKDISYILPKTAEAQP
jgi:quercetin dioxygenase-like cupin family protein